MLQEFKMPPECRPVSKRGVAQPGRAPALGAGSRQFESGRPDLHKPISHKGFPVLLAGQQSITGKSAALSLPLFLLFVPLIVGCPKSTGDSIGVRALFRQTAGNVHLSRFGLQGHNYTFEDHECTFSAKRLLAPDGTQGPARVAETTA